MLAHLPRYAEPIFSACVLFPFIAALFTVPFMVVHYRKYGGIAFMRVIVVYSFILYCMCAYLLTVMPLPAFETVAQMTPQPIGWIPLHDLHEALQKAGLLFSEPSTWTDVSLWKSFLRSSGLFQIIANIVMQIPLGFYLRYYFRRTWKQTLLIGFCVSLFYELTQLSGLYFIYPKPYRYTEVDDLINNTLGAMLGYWLTPAIALLLPSRDEIDRISESKGRRITLIRRLFAAGLDWLVWLVLFTLAIFFVPLGDGGTFVLGLLVMYTGWVLGYFMLTQWLCRGYTMGKALLRIRVEDERTEGGRPTLRQLFVRYGLIYFVMAPLMTLELGLLATVGLLLAFNDITEFIALVVVCGVLIFGTLWALLLCFRKWGDLPHGHLSRTRIRRAGSRGAEKEAEVKAAP